MIRRIGGSLALPCLALLLTAGAAGAQGLKAAASHERTTAPTNSWVAVSRSTTLFTVTAYNSSATDLYLHVFDATAVPANGSIPTMPPVLIPAGKTGGWDYSIGGCKFANGVAVATSTTDRTTTNATASFMINLTHTP
jgi:hypothetical protein